MANFQVNLTKPLRHQIPSCTYSFCCCYYSVCSLPQISSLSSVFRFPLAFLTACDHILWSEFSFSLALFVRGTLPIRCYPLVHSRGRSLIHKWKASYLFVNLVSAETVSKWINRMKLNFQWQRDCFFELIDLSETDQRTPNLQENTLYTWNAIHLRTSHYSTDIQSHCAPNLQQCNLQLAIKVTLLTQSKPHVRDICQTYDYLPSHTASLLRIPVPNYTAWWQRHVCVWTTCQRSL